MKKYIIILLSIINMFSFSKQCYSQATVANVLGNQRVAGDFLGWDGTGTGNSGSLEIRNDFAQPINFFTNTTQKATILANGNVGIGTASPNYHLQIYNSTTSSNVYTQYTTGSTSNTSSDGFLVGVTWNSGLGNNPAELIQQENGPMNFYTNNVQRMAIKGGTAGNANTGYVGIGNAFDSPVSRLHIKEGSDDTWLQLSNTTTGNTSSDGFLPVVGVVSTNHA